MTTPHPSGPWLPPSDPESDPVVTGPRGLLPAASIYSVLERLRRSSTSESEKGAKFERLTRAFLLADPVYAEQFTDVWLWNDWPGRGGKRDTGIDLVARDRFTNGFVAIQCKFYSDKSTVSKNDIDTFMSESGKEGFVERVIVSTTDRWNSNAENAIRTQQIPVRRIGMSDLEASPIDWGQFSLDTPEVLVTVGRKSLRPHQENAIEAVLSGYETYDRGRLIMACGTGKTFTALRLAEKYVGVGGTVLFLVPSISLLSQTLREWSVEADLPIRPVAVCSDAKSTKRSSNRDEDIAVVDLAVAATTDPVKVAARLTAARVDTAAMTVVFSTYQSIDAVAQAQAASGSGPFDLIICDEAHRTTGVTLADDDDESPFKRVHDNSYIQAAKRIYMTATPRIYDDATKSKAGDADAVLASMDDVLLYGPEFYRLGFGEAVTQGLLTDYKVLVLAVDNSMIASTFQSQLADRDGELRLDDVAKIVGCWNGLAKQGHAERDFGFDPGPMRRAVAFAGTIAASRKVKETFKRVIDQYVAVQDLDHELGSSAVLNCEVRHVDGTFNALERNHELDWLRGDVAENSCKILTNARCLSEGVDVPALDSVIFLSPRKSIVDIVQSVGRVMRKAPGKNYGYIILPIAIPEGVPPQVALRDNAKYQVVWEVLQALRAHDDRLNAEINKIDLTSARSDRINVIGVSGRGGVDDDAASQGELELSFTQLDAWRDAVYARIVEKVGSRRYWEDWAKSVAEIAEAHIVRINGLLRTNHGGAADTFQQFIDGLRANLNGSITQQDAVEMLAQHLITRPVFDALFKGYNFASQNPVARAMEDMLTKLDEQNLESEHEDLQKFYDSVRQRVEGIDTAEGRQRIIVELYDTFFSTAFRKTVDKLGIVYTPIEIVDFILQSTDEVIRREFGHGLTGEGVHILDGFTGTGTFISRLLSSGLIDAVDLPRKYQSELHANEILLLAYYIAAVNIETTYQDATSTLSTGQAYEPFEGLVLTDTFESLEQVDHFDYEALRDNNARLAKQKSLPITVIIGNPPYSSGQDSANDNNQNESYPLLDAAIRRDYAGARGRGGNNSLYDSYIRAIKWASLRLADRGVIAFVTNGGFLASNVGSEMRQSLAAEFSSIYVYNLRGNGRVAGEAGRKEGRPIFEFGGWRSDGSEIRNSSGGSRATIAIIMLVKTDAPAGIATVNMVQVDDYLTAGQKIRAVTEARSFSGLAMEQVTPNSDGDWGAQRSDVFASFLPLGAKHGATFGRVTVFDLYGRGLETGRDAWVYQSSVDELRRQVGTTIDAFNEQVDQFRVHLGGRTGKEAKAMVDDFIDLDAARISWTLSLKNRLAALRPLEPLSGQDIVTATYRPFFKQHAYFNKGLNHIRGQTPRFFPTSAISNLGIYVVGMGSAVPFSLLMLDALPDLHVTGAGSGGQFFPRWRFEEAATDEVLDLGTLGDEVSGYRRIDNISDAALSIFREAYGDAFTKDEIFYYVYGIMHSPEYRAEYSGDLTKLLPSVPLVLDPIPFVTAGRELASLHVNYEAAAPYPLDGMPTALLPSADAYSFYRVEKMRFPRSRVQGKNVDDKSTIIYNDRITLSNIPEDAYRYQVGPRSAVEWVMDRYQVKTDRPSGIVNDVNSWAYELGSPTYILDTLARVVTVSLRTVAIVDSLPSLEIRP